MAYLGNQILGGEQRVELFSGNGSTTQFTLAYATGGEASLIVSITGVKQHTNTYSIANGLLNFTTAPPSGTNNIEVVYLGFAVSIGTPADGTVSSLKLTANAVTTTAIADSAIIGAKIADGTLTTEKLGNGMVTTAKIADSNVTTAKIADSAITAAKITDGTITNAKLATPPAISQDSISGLRVDMNGITPTTDLDIQAGQCRDRAYSWAFATDTGSSLTTGLTAYWKLDEATGIRKDSYGWYDMAATRAQPTSTTGKSGAAALFASASSQYLQVPAATDLQLGDISVTFAGWVKLTTKTADQSIFSQYGTTNGTRQFMLQYRQSTDRFRFIWHTNGAGTAVSVSATTFGSPSTSTWYFIVCYHNASNNTIGISVNGGTVDTAAATGGNSTTQEWMLGVDSALTDFSNAALDEWGFWRKVLSSQEITDLYNSGNGQTLTETISNSTNMTCAAMTAKRLSSSWSAGSGGGLLDTGSILASKTYHLFAIQKADGTQDYVASLNPKKPTLPSGYTLYRRIRSVRTNGSSQLIAETQVGNRIQADLPPVDQSLSAFGTNPLALTYSAPTGIETEIQINVEYFQHASGTSGANGRLTLTPLANSPSPGTSPQFGATGARNNMSGPPVQGVASGGMSGLFEVAASRSAQIRMQVNVSDSGVYFKSSMEGYYDPDILGAGRT